MFALLSGVAYVAKVLSSSAVFDDLIDSLHLMTFPPPDNTEVLYAG